ncbi:ComF family protein [Microbacterium tumbae]
MATTSDPAGRDTRSLVLRVTEEALSLLLGVSCTGCGEPGRMLCDACRAALSPSPTTRVLADGTRVTAALRFEGVVARCVRALKEDGATMLARPLADALSVLVPPDMPLVPVPTTRAAFRRRGYRVPDLLIRAAGRRAERLLSPAGRTSDQRGLGRGDRARNVRGSLRATRRGDGSEVIVFDDVVTTGATLSEASAVLGRAGFRVIGAVALAATPRHRDLSADTSGKQGDIRVNADYG